MMPYRFRPQLIPTLAFLVLLPGLINLGMWQLNKARQKQALQQQLEQGSKAAPISITRRVDDPEAIRYRRVRVRGQWEAGYQFLLDNKVNEQEIVGYQVLTPLRISGSDMRVLVNRGWVPAGADRRQLPAVAPPAGEVDVEGVAIVPSTKFFELAKPQDSSTGLEPVWQNLDLARYRQSVPFQLQPVVLLLDPNSAAGGYERNWPRPDERVEKNLGYAYQWFGMAVALVGIYIFVNLKKVGGKQGGE